MLAKDSSDLPPSLHCITKDGGLIGKISSNSKPTFYPCSFSPEKHFQRVSSAAAGPLPTTLYTTEREGLKEITPLFTIFTF